MYKKFIIGALLVFHSGLAVSQDDRSIKELLDHIEKIRLENNQLTSEILDADAAIVELLDRIEELSLEGRSERRTNSNLSETIENLKTISDTVYIDNSADVDELLGKITNLETTITNLNSTITERDKKITRLNTTIIKQNITNDSINNLFIEERQVSEAQREEISKLENDIKNLESKVNCVISFSRKQIQLKKDSESQLSQARNEYAKIYPLHKRTNYENDEIAEIVNNVVDTYIKNQTTVQTMQCKDIPELDYSYDNLKTIDDFYLMRMYAFNEGDVIDKLDEIYGEGNGRQKSVSLALMHLGKVMEKGNYDDKNMPTAILIELLEIMGNLDFYIIPAKTKNADLFALQKIISLYDKKQYAAALSQYNKYRRYLSTDEISQHKDLVNDIEFKMASILIWQLGFISKDRSIYPSSSWLHEIAGDPINTGIEIIRKLMLKKDLDRDIRRKCIITKLKMYDTV